jgi:NACHT domain
MVDPFSTIILSKLIEVALEKSAASISKLLNKSEKEMLSTSENLRANLSIYIKKCLKFSENISVFRHRDELDLENHSIQLTFRNQDRRFYSINSEKILEEVDLLKEKNHQILLGDPGAGKTTTLKRLVNRTFQILFSEDSEEFNYSFPIVVRLSEISVSETLLTHLCHQLGIDYDSVPKEIPYTHTEIVDEKVYSHKLKRTIKTSKEVHTQKIRKVYEYKIGGYSLKYALGEYLNRMKSTIFIDGLDEVNYQIKDEVFNEIKALSNVLTDSKIILSSRYLQEISSFKQFNVNEIKPLSSNQKMEIAELWLENAEVFFAKLLKLPYQDISNRPLFLTYLIRLFKSSNDELPEQAVDVYRQIVLLAIKEWDEDKEQEIKRFSKYKKFNTYRKEEFLSDIAYELTYSQNVKKIFDRDQLKNAYLRVYKKYPGLSFNDKTDILRDIESHNGLIIETSDDRFEFSHLSLQEYLCAKYILEIQISRKHLELLNIYPAPFAIATVLSRKPEEWFAVLFLTNIGEIRASYRLSAEKLFEYIDRLIVEKIVFSGPIQELGLAILSLFFKFERTKVLSKLIEFSKTKFVYESVQKCLSLYAITKTKDGNHYDFSLKKAPSTDFFLKCEEKGTVSIASIDHLIKRI